MTNLEGKPNKIALGMQYFFGYSGQAQAKDPWRVLSIFDVFIMYTLHLNHSGIWRIDHQDLNWYLDSKFNCLKGSWHSHHKEVLGPYEKNHYQSLSCDKFTLHFVFEEYLSDVFVSSRFHVYLETSQQGQRLAVVSSKLTEFPQIAEGLVGALMVLKESIK